MWPCVCVFMAVSLSLLPVQGVPRLDLSSAGIVSTPKHRSTEAGWMCERNMQSPTENPFLNIKSAPVGGSSPASVPVHKTPGRAPQAAQYLTEKQAAKLTWNPVDFQDKSLWGPKVENTAQLKSRGKEKEKKKKRQIMTTGGKYRMAQSRGTSLCFQGVQWNRPVHSYRVENVA